MRQPFVRKFITFLSSVFFAAIIIFFTLQLLPGDPAAVMLGLNASPEAIAALRHELQLDQPVLYRFLHWVTDIAMGDLGHSVSYRVPVTDLIYERLQVTLPLAALSFMVTLVLGLSLGILAAWRAERPFDFVLRFIAQIGLALPNFWLGILLILLFAVHFQFFPAGGFEGWQSGFWPALQSLILPACAIALAQSAILMRITRSALLDIKNEYYIRTAQAKGLSNLQALYKHGLRNALLPILTILLLQLSFLLTGAMIVETVFVLPGLGRLMLQAVAQHDLILVQNLVLLFVVLLLAMNFLLDTVMLWADPRLRQSHEGVTLT